VWCLPNRHWHSAGACLEKQWRDRIVQCRERASCQHVHDKSASSVRPFYVTPLRRVVAHPQAIG